MGAKEKQKAWKAGGAEWEGIGALLVKVGGLIGPQKVEQDQQNG